LTRRRGRRDRGGAWASENHALALDALRTLASELERSHPGATASLREGLEETLTLTLTRLGIRGRLKKTLAWRNPNRVDDRDHPTHLAHRQALAIRRHVPAVNRCTPPPPTNFYGERHNLRCSGEYAKMQSAAGVAQYRLRDASV
jgi:hypothetical protein